MPGERPQGASGRGRPNKRHFELYFTEFSAASGNKRYRCAVCGKESALSTAYRHLTEAQAGRCAEQGTGVGQPGSPERAHQQDLGHAASSGVGDSPAGASAGWELDDAQMAERGMDVSDVYLHEEMCGYHTDREDDLDEIQDAVHVIGDNGLPEVAVEALIHEVQALDVDSLAALVYEPEAIDVGDVSVEQGSWQRSAWHKARFEKVHDGDNPTTDLTVLQAAFHYVEAVYKGSTLAQVQMDIKRALAMYGPACGKPAPDNPRCRYPPSYHICKVICEVGDLTDAEVHLCPAPNCPHLTAFKPMPRQELLQHMKACEDGACHICYCPCGGSRMSAPAEGCSPQPLAPCYFFKDVFQQFFLDKEWVAAAKDARQRSRGNFYSNPEGLRIMDAFEAADVPRDEVWFWELASDGVEMRNFVPHGTQVFLVRCSNVGEELISKARNVKPIMIVPGPVAPTNFAPYWKLIMDLFAAASPLCGSKMSVDVVIDQGNAESQPDVHVEQTKMYIALHAIHMDYIMRAHVTNWYGPSADHSGGWCMCYKGDLIPLANHAARRAGVPTVRVWGYNNDIPQPGLHDAHAKCGADVLQYTNDELIELGERTHAIVAALELTEARKRALRTLGLNSVAEARAELRSKGRRGRLPWCHPDVKEALAYVSAGDIMPVPVSHCLLRGVLRSLLVYAFDTMVSTVPDDHEVVFNSSQREKAEGLEGRIVFPSGFNRNYRCARKNIKSYVIEELASFIFVGCYIAKCGPPGFQALWALLQPALLHYLFGMDDTAEQRAAAEESMLKYAKLLEKFVKEGKVPARLLTPNLHCAICRLPRQEALRGNAALENELFMERFMNIIKGRSKYKTITDVEKSYIRNTEAPQRSLARNRAYFGCKSLYKHSLQVQDVSCGVKGAGLRLKQTLKTTVCGLTRDFAVAAARVIAWLTQPVRDTLTIPVDHEPALLDQLQVSVHTSAQVGGLKFDSRHTPARAGRSRAYQNSFVRLDAADTVSALPLPNGDVDVAEDLHTVAGSVYARIECFLKAHVEGSDSGFALVRVLKSPSRHLFVGTWTTVAVAPTTDPQFSDLKLVALECFKAQLLVLKGTSEIGNLRFVECPEKLGLVYG